MSQGHSTMPPQQTFSEETSSRVTQRALFLFLKPFSAKVVPDPDNFYVHLWELIRGHYILYNKLGVEHGDVTPYNMMIKSAPVRTVMLIDFEH
ncbi:hypothetical protein CYLTODRAFT_494033 [Cylindrobasidium torrendii FP15055 ss-10]|uniref:Protein kinase domain-containing protein n=1 Tax=Cylindrobasidium torrendii FP15055 ss-10 TaxID=1314674 RepID=A0A0D7AY48_9AGAR|nr:hypothetical protein CYLTODRAFT_494033 [Cylindrobasidium torrendii FP15055 ss-10]